jgi:hypothetical protein
VRRPAGRGSSGRGERVGLAAEVVDRDADVVERLGVVPAALGEGVRRQMGLYQEVLAETK